MTDKRKIKLVPFKRYDGALLKNYLEYFFKRFEEIENPGDLILNNKVYLNKVLINDPDYYVLKGDLIEIESEVLPELIPPKLDVIYEDENLCVLNKPSGAHSTDSISGALWPQEDALTWRLVAEDGRINPFVAAVHRLDVDTSGVLTLAKSAHTASVFGVAIMERKVKKIYYAVTSKAPSQDIFEVNDPIGFDTSRPGLFICNGKNSKEASTKFEVVKRFKDLALVKCTPMTGRTHQIRVHLAHINASILGDNYYSKTIHRRLMLHCSEMSFPNVSEFKNSFKAPLPLEFYEF